MTFRRQTHLGSTGTKSLTIVDFVPPSIKSPCGKDKRTFILQLPDELLELILELAASEPDSRPAQEYGTVYNYGALLVLSRVCQRLKPVAQQLLYRNICVMERPTLSAPMVPPSIVAIKLHRTLQEREDFRQHCRYVILFAFFEFSTIYLSCCALWYMNG